MFPAHEAPSTPATPGVSNWVPLGPKAISGGPLSKLEQSITSVAELMWRR
jgi:hypothetical protein